MSYLLKKMIKLNEPCPTTENPGNTVSVIVGHETNLVASFKTPFDNSFTERSMFRGLEERRVEKRKLELRASDWWQGHTGLRLGRYKTRQDAPCSREMQSGFSSVSQGPGWGSQEGHVGILGATCTSSCSMPTLLLPSM